MANKVELKAIKFSETFSEETNCFKANIYFNGKKVGYAENDGHGGSTNCQPFSETRKQFKVCSDYCESLPKIHSEEFNFSMDSNLENVVDELLSQWLIEKDNKKFTDKLKRDCKKNICYGNDTSYRMRGWKTYTIEYLLTIPQGIEAVKNLISKIQSEGETILNTNIPKEILEECKCEK